MVYVANTELLLVRLTPYSSNNTSNHPIAGKKTFISFKVMNCNKKFVLWQNKMQHFLSKLYCYKKNAFHFSMQ